MEVDPLPVLSCGIVDVEMDDLAISMSDVADTCSKDGLNVIYCDR
jgi:hypothetical protein